MEKNISREVFSIYELEKIISKRKELIKDEKSVEAESYTVMLFKKGKEAIGKKLIEEASEVIIASHDSDEKSLISELGDLFYHALVLAAAHNISLGEIEKHLELKHRACSIRDLNLERIERRLKEHVLENPPFSGREMLISCEILDLKGVDVFVFSHNFRLGSLKKVIVKNRFSHHAKALKTNLQGSGIKAKMAVPVGQREDVTRDSEIILPIFILMNSILLPILINLLSAYLKDVIDRPSDAGSNIELDIILLENDEKKERWYRIRGNVQDTCEVLDKINALVK